ncbi:MAG: hypothetical protein KatS3mg109_1343 [Pirellulaceae bacterium]|nr:MAG: hypothetical protein KatS3mg109_1205 [Pirellulaceae bacterium]GIW90911.1 MAG: hypothetical protein KatS3mg109_1343 [Pirellulaceae bacterium]
MGDDRTTTRDRVAELLERDPGILDRLGATGIAELVGVTRQRVEQILRALGWRRETRWVRR